METGTISTWNLTDGSEFSAGDVFCSIETDKATMDFEAQDDGIVAKVLREGSDAVDLPVGTPIAVVVEEMEDVAAFKDFTVEAEAPAEKAPAVEAPSAAPVDAPDVNVTTAAAAAAKALNLDMSNVLMPSARFLSQSKGLDARVLVPGSGRGGRVTKGDVLAALASGTPLPALGEAGGDVTETEPWGGEGDAKAEYSVSPTMETGTISTWNLSDGSEFSAGDVFCSIETDKATMDFEAQDDGFVAKVLREGSDAVDLPVGTPIAVVVEEMEDVAAFKDFTVEVEAPAVEPAAVEAPPSAAPDVNVTTAATAAAKALNLDMSNVLMPSARFLSESKGLDARVLVPGSGRGGRVTKGDVLAALANGTPLPALGETGDGVTELWGGEGDAKAEYSVYDPLPEAVNEPVAAAPASTAAPAAATIPSTDLTDMTFTDITNSNMRKVIAKKLGESKRSIPHFYTSIKSKPEAVNEPVAAAPASTAAPAAATIPSTDLTDMTFTDITNSNMRKVIAKKLGESKRSIPHFYTSIEIQLDQIMTLRQELKAMDVKVSVNDLILRGSALALRDVPEMNSSYDPKTNTVNVSDTVDISVAVATPTGLITPIVPHTDQLGLVGISEKVRELATRAKENKLAPEEFIGGSFTVSNLGMFGTTEFAAIVNPPQCAILAVGGGTRTVVPGVRTGVEGEEMTPKPVIRTIMTARLSADRRVVDEATAALFLQTLQSYLNQPKLLLL
eukprot:CAMPEP_0194445184 /NCGR_PEP_ID=MMETSP0176-20130528/127708_1 /TAXON_ID=216777 /ORGANISM="Proboscia alata, Strain PI-D3" /LENGTH=729 /DNA_ID=CAMNT_0039271701 /DNA_START=338 /DNA_END=2528 /DNA_ORIENTATION=-